MTEPKAEPLVEETETPVDAVDPNVDPALADAIRMSMEEERDR